MAFGTMLGRVGVGALVGGYSSRNESGWGFAGGVAGGMAAGGFLGKFMPKRAGTWGARQLMANKDFKKQFMAREGGKWSGTGLGGWARRNQMFKKNRSINKALGYGGVALAAGMGAGLGSSTLRSNRPY